MPAEPLDVVIGVDTHKPTLTAAVVTVTGAVVDHVTVPADPKRCRRLTVAGKGKGSRPTVWWNCDPGSGQLSSTARICLTPYDPLGIAPPGSETIEDAAEWSRWKFVDGTQRPSLAGEPSFPTADGRYPVSGARNHDTRGGKRN